MHPSLATQVKKRMLPRKQENAVPGKFLYDCPFCNVGVTSSVRTGQVDHRKVCGHFLRVRDGKLALKVYNYVCPFCGGHVASNVKTGQVNHRGVCGNRFYVETGEVKKTRHHAHKCPDCQTRVWSARSWGRIRIIPSRQDSNARQPAGKFQLQRRGCFVWGPMSDKIILLVAL